MSLFLWIFILYFLRDCYFIIFGYLDIVRLLEGKFEDLSVFFINFWVYFYNFGIYFYKITFIFLSGGILICVESYLVVRIIGLFNYVFYRICDIVLSLVDV